MIIKTTLSAFGFHRQKNFLPAHPRILLYGYGDSFPVVKIVRWRFLRVAGSFPIRVQLAGSLGQQQGFISPLHVMTKRFVFGTLKEEGAHLEYFVVQILFFSDISVKLSLISISDLHHPSLCRS
jgi:hypothetical protein